MQPAGVFGGTFDPIHFGHLRLAVEAMDNLGLQSVRIIPAGSPPHRDGTAANAAARLDMARLATASEPRFMVDAAEVDNPAPSYTVDTLLRLRRELGSQASLCLLLGADAFLSLTSWSRWQQLFELAHLCVATRAGHAFDAGLMPPALRQEFTARHRASPAVLAETPAGRVVPFAMSQLSISASAIREQIARGASPRYLLPDAVLDYIASNRLYT